jgi:cytochrome c2
VPTGQGEGNRMPYGGMSDAKDVDDVIAYLMTLK